MPSNRLILCRPLLFLPSIFPSLWVFSNELASDGQGIGALALASNYEGYSILAHSSRCNGHLN